MRLMGSSRHSTSSTERSNGLIVLTGTFKKLKNGKRKYFILRDEDEFSTPRLEYYDTEKKFNAGQMPKRSIALKTCFDIGKKLDPKYRNVIALYTKDDCFCFVVDNDETFNTWLKKLIALQRGEELDVDDSTSPVYDNHVWMVHVLCKSLGTSSVINPRRLNEPLPYKVSLTDRLLIFLRMEYDNDGSLINSKPIEFPLTCIRSCGYLKNYFLLELGRCSVLGPGEIWIQTEDSAIAENFCKIVLRSMPSNSSSKEELCPQARTRASSATEATKPEMAARRQRPVYTQDGSSTTGQPVPGPSSSQSTQIQSIQALASGLWQPLQRVASALWSSKRRHSVSGSTTVTTAGTVVINHQRTRSLPLANPATTTTTSTINVITSTHTNPNENYSSQPSRAAKRPNLSSKCFSGSTSRERCDSMPSRARTSSEGTHSIQSWSQIKYHNKCYRPYLVQDMSHSPPSQLPMSPPSASTDSAGSSLSVDETWPEDNLGRYGHSITPEQTIAEEDYTVHRLPQVYLPLRISRTSEHDPYVDMSPSGKHVNTSPTASSSSITSGTPSTDIRFAEMPLERVTSYLGQSEEELNGERPARAYSVGSRPDHGYNSVHSMDQHNKSNEKSRERALSVGSKGRKMPSRILHHHTAHQPSGVKSSSAPILVNSRTHSSLDPMDDLMEIDFSKASNLNTTTSGYVEMKPGKPNSGYVEMKPGIRQNSLSKTPDDCPYMDMRPGTSPTRLPITHFEHITSNTSQDYIDMDPRKNRNAIKPSTSPLMSSLSPPTGETKDGYMDMNFNKNHLPDRLSYSSDHYYTSSGKNSSSSSPLHPQESPPSMDYMDMNFYPRTCSSSSKKQQQHHQQQQHHHQQQQHHHLAPSAAASSKTNDGYVEMSLGNKSGHQRQSSLDSAKISPDYTNMSLGGSSKKERRPSKREKAKSQPIQIQNNNANQSMKNSKGSSPNSPMCGVFYPRKYSTGTSPNMILQLSSSGSPYSSLTRQHSRKNHHNNSNSNNNNNNNSSSSSGCTMRRDSRDSSSSSINTPSSSSTIFPISLNSPSSPVKPPTTATTTTIPSSSSASTITNTKLNEPVILKVPPGVLNVRYSNNDDYTMMDNKYNNKRDSNSSSSSSGGGNYRNFEFNNRRDIVDNNKKKDIEYNKKKSSNNDDNDYVNYNPVKNKIIQERIECGDYAIMKPGCPIKTVTTTTSTTKKLIDNVENCFRPISSSSITSNCNEDYAMMNDLHLTTTTTSSSSTSPSPCCETKENHQETKCQQQQQQQLQQQRPSSVSSEKSNLSRPSSTSSDVGSTTSTIIGINNSRPSSSNSDKIIKNNNNADILHYASLDLVKTNTEDDSKNQIVSNEDHHHTITTTISPAPTTSTTAATATTTTTTSQHLLLQTGCTYVDIDFVKSEGKQQQQQQQQQ